jgi:hypothetical protein
MLLGYSARQKTGAAQQSPTLAYVVDTWKEITATAVTNRGAHTCASVATTNQKIIRKLIAF